MSGITTGAFARGNRRTTMEVVPKGANTCLFSKNRDYNILSLTRGCELADLQVREILLETAGMGRYFLVTRGDSVFFEDIKGLPRHYHVVDTKPAVLTEAGPGVYSGTMSSFNRMRLL